MKMDEESWIVVDNGEIFEGTRWQFMDCFFSDASDDEIKDWCFDYGYKLRIDGVVIYA